MDFDFTPDERQIIQKGKEAGKTLHAMNEAFASASSDWTLFALYLLHAREVIG